VFMIQNWMHRLRPKSQQRLITSHFPPTDPAIWLHFQSIHRILPMFPTKPFFIYHSTTLLWSLFYLKLGVQHMCFIIHCFLKWDLNHKSLIDTSVLI